MGGKHQNLDAVVNIKFPNDWDSASIFSKVIGHKLSDGSSDNLYLRCRMDFRSDVVQTEAPQLVDFGLTAINTLNESRVFGAPATSIRRPTDVSHWITPDHVFGEATAFGMSSAKSDHDYIYNTDF